MVDLFTGTFNENLNVQIVSELIETCQPTKFLVLHIQPENRGSASIEIDGKKGGSMIATVKRLPTALTKDQWINPKTLPTVSEIDILHEHPGGYISDRNIAYDEIETIALQPGVYWAGVVITFPDGDYVDQSIIVKVSEESCSSSK